MKSAYRKLDWARRRTAELQADVDEYRKLDAINFRQKTSPHLFDPSKSVLRFYAEIDPEMPDWWGLAVGDALGSLRAALDHALVGHVRTQVPTLTEAQEKRLQFPILDDEAKWMGTSKEPGPGRKLRDKCDPTVLKAIQDCQPFVPAWSESPEEHPLMVLNKMVNNDKHRESTVVAYASHQLTVDTSRPSAIEILELIQGEGELVHDALAATIVVRQPRAAGRRTRAVALDPAPELGFVETLRIPGIADDPGVGVMTMLEFLISGVQTTLDELKAAGA